MLIPADSDSDKGTPLAAVGHSAHCIDNSMFVIFGHNPVYGYLNTVQRFDFGMTTVFILFDIRLWLQAAGLGAA